MTSAMTEVEAFLAASIVAPPLHAWMQVKLEAYDPASGEVRLRLPMREAFKRNAARPHIHGGILAALADIAGHAAVAAKVRHGVPTIDMRVDFLRMAAGEYLIATASLVKFGRTIALADVRITDAEGRLVATGRAAYSTQER